MADTRRGRRDDSIYFDHRVDTACLDARLHKACAGRWRGAVLWREICSGAPDLDAIHNASSMAASTVSDSSRMWVTYGRLLTCRPGKLGVFLAGGERARDVDQA
jgi:hypothetical protein